MPGTNRRDGLDAVLALVGGKWKLLILFHLSEGRHRFNELRRQINGISERMLAKKLRQMIADGIVKRIDHRTVPPRVEYETTEFGLGLGRALLPLCDWGVEQFEAIIEMSGPQTYVLN